MTPVLNRLAEGIPGSSTQAVANRPLTHADPISLAVGEPPGPPPTEALEAAARTLRDGGHRYGPPRGSPELRQRLAEDAARRSGIPRAATDVLLTCGAKEALLAAIRCIVEPGDEILLPAPYWPTFRDQAAWAGARAVATPPDASLGVDMDALEAAVNPLTRAIVVNDPNNPTGRTWGAERLRRVARIAREHDLWLVADQVYTDLVLDGGAATLWTVAPEVHDRTIVVESFSKRYSMCGFRLGAAYGPPAVLDAMARLTSAATTHPCRVAQAAGLAALDTSPAWDDRERERYRALRRQALDALRRIPELECARPEAAFYLFPRLRGRDGAAVDDARVCADLAARWGLLLQPGSAFGAPGHLRLSYAVDPTTLARGLDRLGEALAELDPVYALPSLEHSL